MMLIGIDHAILIELKGKNKVNEKQSYDIMFIVYDCVD